MPRLGALARPHGLMSLVYEQSPPRSTAAQGPRGPRLRLAETLPGLRMPVGSKAALPARMRNPRPPVPHKDHATPEDSAAARRDRSGHVRARQWRQGAQSAPASAGPSRLTPAASLSAAGH